MAQTMSVTQLQETRESQAPISLPLVDRRGSSRSDQVRTPSCENAMQVCKLRDLALT